MYNQDKYKIEYVFSKTKVFKLKMLSLYSVRSKARWFPTEYPIRILSDPNRVRRIKMYIFFELTAYRLNAREDFCHFIFAV